MFLDKLVIEDITKFKFNETWPLSLNSIQPETISKFKQS